MSDVFAHVWQGFDVLSGFKFLFTYAFEKQREGETELPSADSLPECQ